MLRNPGLRKSVEQPVLDLNFAASQIGSNAAPDARIDFSRGSNAYFVDSDGLVKKSPHNLLLRSEDFGTTWSATRSNVTTDATTSPIGTLTADKLYLDSTSSTSHFAIQNVSIGAGQKHTFSVYLKADDLTHAHVSLLNNTAPFEAIRIAIDLSDGSTNSLVVGNGASSGSFNVTDAGNGWYRVEISGIIGSSATASAVVYLAESTSTFIVATADGSSGIFVWGAQLSQHTTLPVDNPYIKTTGSAVYAARLDHDPTWFMSAAQEQNLLQYSEMLDNSGWLKYQSTVTANAAVAPDGTTTAEKLASSNTLEGAVIQDVEGNPSVTYVFSIYLKKDEFDEAELHLNYRGGGSSLYRAIYDVDLTAGTIAHQAGSTATTTITDDGDGWFRVTISQPSPASTDTVRAEVNAPVGNASGDGILVWGAQLEVGSTASTYHRTEGAPYYGPGATAKGLLIEEQRANLLTDSDVDSWFDGTRVTITTGAALAPDGTTTAEKVAKTAASFKYVSDGFTAASTGDFTASGYLKAGSLDEVTVLLTSDAGATLNGFVIFNLTNETSTDISSSALVSKTLTDVGNGWYRFTIAATFSNTTNPRVFVYPGIYNQSVAGDIFVWGFQVEAGSFATSFIQTTGSTATRNADVATMGPTTGGTEIVTNGTYDTDTSGWSNSRSTLSVVSGKLRVTSTGGNYPMAFQDLTTVIGRRYRVTADITFGTTAGAVVQINSETGQSFTTSGGVLTSSGSVSFDFTANITNTQIILHGNTGTSAGQYQEFDNVSVRELYPFEAYNPSEGTVVCEFERHDNTAFDYIWSFGFGTDGQNEAGLVHLDATRVFHNILTGGAQQITYSPVTVEPGDRSINAFAYQTNNVNASFSRNGSFTHSFNDTSYSNPPTDKFGIGIRLSEIGVCNNHIKRLTYYPYRLNDAVCDSKVSS